MNFNLLGRDIGDEISPLAVCEMGINHGGSLEKAISMIEAANSAGAEVIKLQTHIAKHEMSSEALKIVPQHCEQSIYQIIEDSSLSLSDEKILFEYAGKKGIRIFSTPFSREAVDHLLTLGVGAFKVGSGECNNWPLLDYIASQKLPIIVSTGMHGLDTVTKAVDTVTKHTSKLALMHCTNLYPTPSHLVRLGGVADLKKHFPDFQIGLSDHTKTNYSCFGAIALGANFVEKHFCLSHQDEGPDIVCSNDPTEWRELMAGCHEIFLARGGNKTEIREEQDTRNFAFASVVAIRDIAAGETLSSENIWVKRPAGGDFSTDEYYGLLGRQVMENIEADTQVRRYQISWS